MIRHLFDTAGAWAAIRFGLWSGAGLASLIWTVWFHEPTVTLTFA
ncbi:hypothetical protein [Nocardiopsis synnemataformans]